MKTTQLILVGGFLGTGKTTLLWEVARKIISWIKCFVFEQ